MVRHSHSRACVRVQLVDGAVGFDAGVVLGDAAVAEEAGVSVVTGACIDGHAPYTLGQS